MHLLSFNTPLMPKAKKLLDLLIKCSTYVRMKLRRDMLHIRAPRRLDRVELSNPLSECGSPSQTIRGNPSRLHNPSIHLLLCVIPHAVAHCQWVRFRQYLMVDRPPMKRVFLQAPEYVAAYDNVKPKQMHRCSRRQLLQMTAKL